VRPSNLFFRPLDLFSLEKKTLQKIKLIPKCSKMSDFSLNKHQKWPKREQIALKISATQIFKFWGPRQKEFLQIWPLRKKVWPPGAPLVYTVVNRCISNWNPETKQVPFLVLFHRIKLKALFGSKNLSSYFEKFDKWWCWTQLKNVFYVKQENQDSEELFLNKFLTQILKLILKICFVVVFT